MEPVIYWSYKHIHTLPCWSLLAGHTAECVHHQISLHTQLARKVGGRNFLIFLKLDCIPGRAFWAVRHIFPIGDLALEEIIYGPDAQINASRSVIEGKVVEGVPDCSWSC